MSTVVDDLMALAGEVSRLERDIIITGEGVNLAEDATERLRIALESALQSSEQAGYERGRISGQERAALTTIMRRAESAKEPCGDDPESAAAIRNGKFASIAQMAAQGLGMVRGPTFEPEQAAEPVAWLYTYRKIGGDYCYSRVDTWDSPPWPAAGSFELVSTTPLYTSPPKREPLTHQQRVKIMREADSPLALILKTERAHGIGDE